MWKNRVIYIISLAAVCAFFAEYNGWISYFALLLALFLPVLSLLCSLPMLLGARLYITAPSCCPRGEEIGAELTLDSRFKRCGLVCSVRLAVRDAMAGTESVQKRRMTTGQCEAAPLPSDHCGVYTLRATRCRAYDMLGLFYFNIRLPDACNITVEPRAAMPTPAPDFQSFRVKSFKPLPGGGFSEIHELREYRPGDPLKTVHWKLSAKTDGLIVREAQEPERRSAAIALELTSDRDKTDASLDELRWVSERLIELGVAHNIYYVNRNGGPMNVCPVSGETGLSDALASVMSTELQAGSGEGAPAQLPQADWLYRIAPKERGAVR